TVSDPRIQITEARNHEVQLVALGAGGCADTARLTVQAAGPQMHIVLNNIQLVSDQSGQRILLSVADQGHPPVGQLEAVISVSDDLSSTPTIQQRIDPGENRVVNVNFGVPSGSLQIQYICVDVRSFYESETNPADNTGCVNLTSGTLLESPFPNPASA